MVLAAPGQPPHPTIREPGAAAATRPPPAALDPDEWPRLGSLPLTRHPGERWLHSASRDPRLGAVVRHVPRRADRRAARHARHRLPRTGERDPPAAHDVRAEPADRRARRLGPGRGGKYDRPTTFDRRRRADLPAGSRGTRRPPGPHQGLLGSCLHQGRRCECVQRLPPTRERSRHRPTGTPYGHGRAGGEGPTPRDVPGRGHRAPTRSTPPGGMTPWVCVHRTQRPVYAETDTHGALCTLGNPVPVRS
jgi:hypothetical protein